MHFKHTTKHKSCQTKGKIACILEDDENYSRIIDKCLRDLNFESILETRSLAEVSQFISSARIHLFVCDLSLPDGKGQEAIKWFRKANKVGRCLVISSLSSKSELIEALRSGADGYILKGEPIESVKRSMATVLNSNTPISAELTKYLVEDYRQEDNSAINLTVREMEVLQLLAKGFSASEMAGILSISVNTIPAHKKNIYKKLKVSNRAEASYEASKLGLLK